MPKITLLGAGSGFTAGLMRDLMMIPNLKGGDIALVDIDPKRLRVTTRLVQALADRVKTEIGGTWTVTGATDRREVLKGTDYIINCIEVSGLKCVEIDNDIPLKYGVDQCIGDTIGPGGIFKALRTVPAWLEILADIEKLCPNALVMNYTNPMSIMTLAAVRGTSAPVVGLCHSVQGTAHQLARRLDIPYKELSYKCAGVNHLAWYTELNHKGKDVYPELFRRARRDKEMYEQDPVRFEMMFEFGAFITESSGHLSEYLPYFRKRPDLMKAYCRDGYRGGSRFYASNWPAWRKASDERRDKLAKNIHEMKLERGKEYASEIIEGHYFDMPKVIYGSVPNDGLIANLPQDGVVEVAVMVNRTGFNPCRFGSLPPQMAALCDWQMRVYDLVVRGIMDGNRESIVHAMMLDPLTAAVCSPAEIRSMTDEMSLAEKRYIPAFMSKGVKKPVRKAGATKAVRSRKTKDTGPFKA